MAKVIINHCHPFDNVETWSVSELHGVPLIINQEDVMADDGDSLDVEDDEEGGFVGLGIYSHRLNTCFYWSDFDLVKHIKIPKFVAHNGISDLRKLQKWGFAVDESWLLHDTQLMAHILDSTLKDYSLKNLTKTQLGQTYPTYSEICGKKSSKDHKTLKAFPAEHVAAYNAADCYYTYQLYLRQKGQGSANLLETPALNYFKRVEAPAAVVFDSMEEKGIRIDVPYLKTLEKELSAQRAVIEKQIKNELGDINLNSPKQLLGALREKEIRPELKGKPSTDKRALQRLDKVPLVRTLLSYSELDTLLSSFVVPYLERGVDVVHPYFNQCGTRTGRPSCSNPNLLQIPKRSDNGNLVRRMFIPRSGCSFAELDYGQIEPRLLAHMSGDSNMLSMFRGGTDFHTYTSERLGIDRDKAKVLNLSVGYRATFKSVSAQLKCSDAEAQQQIDSWWKAFPHLYAWQTKLIWQAKKDGFFTTLMGRRIKVDNLGEYNKWKREAAERQVINNIAQASAQEVMKIAMAKVYKAGINVLVQVYDSLLIEEKTEDIEDAVGMTKSLLESSTKLEVPLVADVKIGDNWSFNERN